MKRLAAVLVVAAVVYAVLSAVPRVGFAILDWLRGWPEGDAVLAFGLGLAAFGVVVVAAMFALALFGLATAPDDRGGRP